jgi:predicted secreted protein
MIYTISTGFAIYFVIWWIVLFLTLAVRGAQPA